MRIPPQTEAPGSKARGVIYTHGKITPMFRMLYANAEYGDITRTRPEARLVRPGPEPSPSRRLAGIHRLRPRSPLSRLAGNLRSGHQAFRRRIPPPGRIHSSAHISMEQAYRHLPIPGNRTGLGLRSDLAAYRWRTFQSSVKHGRSIEIRLPRR